MAFATTWTIVLVFMMPVEFAMALVRFMNVAVSTSLQVIATVKEMSLMSVVFAEAQALFRALAIVMGLYPSINAEFAEATGHHALGAPMSMRAITMWKPLYLIMSHVSLGLVVAA